MQIETTITTAANGPIGTRVEELGETILSLSSVEDCATLATERQRQICRGETSLPVEVVEKYRSKWFRRSRNLAADRTNVNGSPPDHDTSITANRASAKTPSPPIFGPGDALRELLESLGISSEWCEGCTSRRAQMNAWGVDGCRQNVDVIAQWLADAAREAGPRERLRAAWGAVCGGVWVNPLDPYRGLVNRAIDAAEQRSLAHAAR